VIQIEAVHIRELRGIRDLEIKPGRKSFVISGPNGSGKSGVVDAIEFGLTGEISRLSGKGTVGLTVQRHGPHVDRRDDPAVAEVSLTLYVPETKKTAVLTRNVKTAKTFSLNPDDPGIRAAVEETARHPELILSRREIIKYIIVEAGDEGEFKAKLEPSEGKLDLEVDFYGRGMFPPGAYHSEGHQDGMGVCLYFALMKRLLGERFRFAVLDDVVMSVDQNHRKEFCRLLKTRFPDTQFIITTHDKVWAKQMQTEGLVEPRGGVAFHSWSVQTGPIFEQISGVWDQIEADLAKNDVPTAAGRLRRHLEYISGELADQLGAQTTYRGDFSYDLGDLLPAVIGRQGEIVKLAAKAANDWKDEGAKAKVEAMKTARSEALAAYGGEGWVINKAIHYNEWADFSKAEFRQVVAALKTLLLQFRCPKPECDSWLYITPKKGDPEVLRCRCMGVNLNLKPK
jgi:hypothetical protein